MHHGKTRPKLTSPLHHDAPKRTTRCNQSSNYAKTLKVNTALQSVFLGTKPKRTVVCNQSSNYAKTLKGEYSAAISFPWYETGIDGAMQSLFQLCQNPKGACSAAIGLPWYEPKRAVVCNQASHYAKTPKVSTALQSVFLGTNLDGRWYAIIFPLR